MKKFVAALLAASLCVLPARATVAGKPDVDAASALLMEKETGEILYELNSHDRMEPASVTKIMTLLLVMEAIDGGSLSKEDTVRVSARAASMGGSQVYLKESDQLAFSYPTDQLPIKYGQYISQLCRFQIGAYVLRVQHLHLLFFNAQVMKGA